MRSDAGFDKFITEGLKEAASRVEVPVRCKTAIDTRIMSAESDQQTGGIKQMRSWTFRKSAAAVVICCLLIGTGVFAAGRIVSVVSHGSSEPRVTEYAKIDELEAEAGFTMRTKEDFSNGFAFTGGGIVVSRICPGMRQRRERSTERKHITIIRKCTWSRRPIGQQLRKRREAGRIRTTPLRMEAMPRRRHIAARFVLLRKG